MNKKMIVMGVPLLAGTALLFTSGLTASAGAGGYEVYKAALKNNMAVSSLTADVALKVQDNGSPLIHIQGKVKADQDHEAAHASVTVDNGTLQRTMDLFGQEGKLVLKNSEDEIYYTLEKSERMQHHRQGDHPPQFLENVADALLGNVKNRVELTEQPDGMKQVSLHLSDSQIHPVVQLIGSHMLQKAGEHPVPEKRGGMPPFQPLFGEPVYDKLPKLTEDVRIKSVDVTADITPQQQISNESVRIAFTGKDSAGEVHEITVSMQVGMSDFGVTVPEKADLTGKTVKELERSSLHHGGRR